jgi:general secretion pathway protein J
MELLLSILVCAVVMLSLHYVFVGAVRLRNRTTEAIAAVVPQQHALMLIRRDLANVVAPAGTSALSGQFVTAALSGLQNATAIAGRPVGPTFHTASGMVDELTPWTEVRKVSYQLSPPTNREPGLDLYRNVTRNLLPTLTEQVEAQRLLGGVEEVYFEFYDGTQWRDTWDGTNETTVLPTAVRVQIQLVAAPEQRTLPPPIEMVVPIHVQAAAAETTDTSGGEQ